MYEIKCMTIQDYEGVSKLWGENGVSLEVVGTVLCGHDGRRGSVVSCYGF